MGATEAIEVQADYSLKGPDYETILVGHPSAEIMDADRAVRREFNNGFPNWALYRTALAGDAIHMPYLRRWAVAFAVAYCTTGGVKRHAYSDELACVAGWDALHMLVFCRQLQPYTVTADALGVDPKTYARVRRNLYARMRASLDEYWIRLQVEFRIVVLANRKI